MVFPVSPFHRSCFCGKAGEKDRKQSQYQQQQDRDMQLHSANFRLGVTHRASERLGSQKAIHQTPPRASEEHCQ